VIVNAVDVVAISFKLQNSINHVLQYFWSSNVSVFGNMTNQYNGMLVSLANLISSAVVLVFEKYFCRRFNVIGVQCLNESMITISGQ
jgi:hypothetical protein